MSWTPLRPIQVWKVFWVVVPQAKTRYSTTSHLLAPSARVPTKTPGAPVPSRSVQNGASTLFGVAGSAPVGSSQQLLSAAVAPPATR
jgi:hypothetical protein